jgi:hypothetical protein
MDIVSTRRRITIIAVLVVRNAVLVIIVILVRAKLRRHIIVMSTEILTGRVPDILLAAMVM